MRFQGRPEELLRDSMHNFVVSVRATSREAFNLAIAIAVGAIPGGKVRFFCVTPHQGLVMFWCVGGDEGYRSVRLEQLPFEMDAVQAAEYAWKWYERTVRESFKLENDDAFPAGEDVRGVAAYHIRVGPRGHDVGARNVVCSVLPCWGVVTE